MSESVNHLLAELHAERQRTWASEALQVNIDQRQRLVDEANPERFVKAGDIVEPFELLKVEGGSLDLDQLLSHGPALSLIHI